jgi:hypothetical protein
VDIDFNRWVSQEGYRRTISSQLGLRYLDEGRDEVVDFGEGSSFDGLSLNGRGSDMRVLDRWRELEMDSRYRELVSDHRFAALARSYFGMEPPWPIAEPRY